MSAEILKGAAVAAAMNGETAERAGKLREKGIAPCLAIVRVGERADDLAYEKGILKRCAAVGVEAKQYIYPIEIDNNKLINNLCKLNEDDSIHGILVFMPLPGNLDENAVRAAMLKLKL